KPALLHDFLFSVGSHSLKFQLVRKFQGRSPAANQVATNAIAPGTRGRRPKECFAARHAARRLGQVRSKTGPVPVLGQTSLISISVTDFRNDHSVYREYAGLWAFFSSRNSNP
ncbi:hypothetical protein, partial [Burkholderia pseudomallei]